MNILFIGGAGFIGSNLIRKIAPFKYAIHVVEPKGAYVGRLHDCDVSIHECSLSDVDGISTIIKENEIEIVVHLVSTLIPGSSYEDYKNEYQNMIFP